MKHIVNVTISNPAHEFVSMRNRQSTTNYMVEAKDEAEAILRASRHFKSLGHYVHNAAIVEQNLNEEVEQIDELKKSTLASYATKAARNIRTSHSLAAGFDDDHTAAMRKVLKNSPNVDPHKGHIRSPSEKAQGELEMKATADLRDKFKRRAQNRITGIGRAVAKLAKEEVEQLDEVGPQKKMKRLFNKLRDARAGARYKESGMPVPPREPGHKNTVDHNKALGRALRREEAEQIDELSQKTLRNYLKAKDKVYQKDKAAVWSIPTTTSSGRSNKAFDKARLAHHVKWNNNDGEEQKHIDRAHDRQRAFADGSKGKKKDSVGGQHTNAGVMAKYQQKGAAYKKAVDKVKKQHGVYEEADHMPVAPVPGDKWKSHAVMVHPETKQRIVVARKNAKNYPESDGWKEVAPGMRLKKEEVEQVNEMDKSGYIASRDARDFPKGGKEVYLGPDRIMTQKQVTDQGVKWLNKAIRKSKNTKNEEVVSEKAPPGKEQMVKDIKKAYSKDGVLTDKEKAIAYATAWKAKNAGK